ncbi:glycosyltransferase family 2 protein, partial [Rhodopseudomonas sp. B29]|uniref:glycosyltransferase family 2 protein n=1 Tax=Rhodopseudomonas sp. B29 TaxID=95607 RepID=UPI000688AF0B
MSDVAVFYLARAKEGLEHFQAFAQSLRRHPAGIDYDLILICKGFEKRAESVLVSRIFAGIPHRLTYVDDDIGQDIQAYKVAAARFTHTYACFFNTFSEIVADDWLKKYYQAMTSPQAGLVGATASFESLNNSYRLIFAAQWLASQPLRYHEELYRSFRWLIGSPYGAVPNGKTALRRIRRLLGDVLNNRPRLDEVMPDFPAAWARVSAEGAPYRFATDFPNFPNPHIRSNAFMVRRQEMLDTPLAAGDKKLAGCNFESGADGLSARILKRGERLLLVGADGVAYDIPEWMNAGCFRSKDQSNLLVVDNQTKAYMAFSEPERAVNRALAWGSYLPGTPPTIYGNHFDDRRPLSEFGRLPRQPARERFLSIVIPTHNRLELTIDAIRTVQKQNYQNWEIAVFDNASNEDVSAAVRALGDDRIRCERSDEFLPVTKSWNRALNMARGEYVTLIGDDDGLAPGFFERIVELADRFDSPEVIFSALYQFFHPGVLPGRPLGYVQTLPTADFMSQRDYPFLLDKRTAQEAVASSLNLRRRFMFNMPAFTVRRDFLDSIRRDGEVLHPPFPDYYFAN